MCDRFEKAWRGGDDPRMEDFVGQLAEGQREDLFAELLGLELRLRRDNEEGPTPVLSCRRKIRIAAARALPRLATKLRAVAENTIAEIDQAADRFC